MVAFLIILFILITILSIVGVILYVHSRNVLREQKNFERGLKMVPLLIHPPPPSEDIQSSGRDSREIMDENISKAQVLYNIIASTLEKGFKRKFYGQRHFTLEIVSVKGFIYFYTAVPIALLDVVKQAVVSAYPSATLEEVAEHNIFSPVGKLSGTVGGELSLKENFAYPIATYQDLKRDTMQSLLNALSTLEKEDGAGVQILLRPADPSWRKTAQSVASSKRKGKDSKKGGALAAEWGKQLATAAVKPPGAKDEKGGSDKPDLSSHEQSVLDAIDQKTAYPGYEVLVRVVVSSNITHKAQTILKNIVASFALYDAPGRNGFEFTPSKDIESFVTSYIMRFFPPENNQNVLNSIELATLFHFPDQTNIPTTQLERQASKQADSPRNVSEEGLFLGYNVFRGVKKPIRLAEIDRARHMYIVGQTGTGKSTLLENLALQDMLEGKGFAFIDPHGDTAENLLAMIPKERTEDVIYFSPADMEYPLGLNLFEYDLPEQKDFLVQEAINMLYKLYDPQRQGIVGPRYEYWFRNAALTVMANPEGGTFIDIPKVFTDKQYEKHLRQFLTDQTVIDFWSKEMAQTADFHKSEVLGWFVSKFGAFLSNEMMRNIIGQTKSSFNLRKVMDEGKILLVNLSKGRTGELNSKLLGMIFVMKFQAAAMSRANIPENERKNFSLYVDEFQNFSTDSFATILSEARKYHLDLIVANQFTTQLTDEIRDAVFGNIGTIISFRVGTNDADFLSKQFTPVFDTDDLQRIPNYNAVMRMLLGGVPAQPFSMSTVPPLGEPNRKLSEALKQLSAAKYGRPKAKVEAEIFKRLKSSEEPPASPFGQPRPANAARPMPAGGANRGFGRSPLASSPAVAPQPGQAQPPMPGKKLPGSASFLDEWLAKRRTAPPSKQPPLPPQSPPVAPGAKAGVGVSPSTVSSQPAPQPQLQPTQKLYTQPPAQQPGVGLTPPSVASSQPGVLNPTFSQPVASAKAGLTPPDFTQKPPQQPPGFKPSNQVAPSPKSNISSNKIEQQKASNIAAELNQTLNNKAPAGKNTSKDGIIHLNKHPFSADTNNPEDTIYIDREGTLHRKDKDEAEH